VQYAPLPLLVRPRMPAKELQRWRIGYKAATLTRSPAAANTSWIEANEQTVS
jgi:hypothetical protein